MKILLVNNFLYNRGGDTTYLHSLGDLLQNKKHQVLFWGMDHPENAFFEYGSHFLKYKDYNLFNSERSLSNVASVLKESIYSRKSQHKFEKFIEITEPDIVHLNNIHSYITPSIIDTINKKAIPIVWTLHDFNLLCPDSHFMSNNVICEACKGGKFYNCTIKSCKKESFVASAAASIEAYAHKFLRIRDKISYYIAPSKFLANKFIEFGYPASKIIQIPNFIHSGVRMAKRGKYLLYFGGLNQWKGVGTLLHAIRISNIRIPLKIAGTGSEISNYKQYVAEFKLDNVEFLGHLSVDQMKPIIEGSLFVVIPSECYENYPYSAIEAMSNGKPIVGSNIGGIPELVKDNVTGLLFKPGDVNDLKHKIELLYSDNQLLSDMSDKAILWVKQNLTQDIYYNKVMNVYMKAIKWTYQ
jgi:glycosyltransferase involved in cell wall biosynthesis